VRFGAVEAQDVAWARQPNLAVSRQELASVEVAKEADQAESHIVFVTVNLCNGIRVDLQRAPDDTIRRRIQRSERLVDLATQILHSRLSGSSSDFGSVEVIRRTETNTSTMDHGTTVAWPLDVIQQGQDSVIPSSR
jgi:hypothetical protein